MEGSFTGEFIFALMDAVMGPPADQPSAEPRRRMINELHSLAQLAAKYDIVPQDDFTEWLKNVLTINTANPYEHDDAKFVSDVLEYQLDDEVVPGTTLQRSQRSTNILRSHIAPPLAFQECQDGARHHHPVRYGRLND